MRKWWFWARGGQFMPIINYVHIYELRVITDLWPRELSERRHKVRVQEDLVRLVCHELDEIQPQQCQ
jgi:hypothetical protein